MNASDKTGAFMIITYHYIVKNKQKWKRRIYYESIRIQKMQYLHESIKMAGSTQRRI